MYTKLFLAVAFFFVFFISRGQLESIHLDPEKVQKFLPFVKFKHGANNGFETWRENNKMLYIKELWYYTESFYVKRNYSSEGTVLDESMIDISRFENRRHPTEEVIVPMPGFKDALVLMPSSKLIYKPE